MYVALSCFQCAVFKWCFQLLLFVYDTRQDAIAEERAAAGGMASEPRPNRTHRAVTIHQGEARSIVSGH